MILIKVKGNIWYSKTNIQKISILLNHKNDSLLKSLRIKKKKKVLSG